MKKDEIRLRLSQVDERLARMWKRYPVFSAVIVVIAPIVALIAGMIIGAIIGC